MFVVKEITFWYNTDFQTCTEKKKQPPLYEMTVLYFYYFTLIVTVFVVVFPPCTGTVTV